MSALFFFSDYVGTNTLTTSGLVNTCMGIWENVAFFVCFGISSALKQHFRSLKSSCFKTPSRVKIFKNCLYVDLKTCWPEIWVFVLPRLSVHLYLLYLMSHFERPNDHSKVVRQTCKKKLPAQRMMIPCTLTVCKVHSVSLQPLIKHSLWIKWKDI